MFQRSFRHLGHGLAALCLLAAGAAHAATVHGLRDWLEGLNGVYAAQDPDNLWTFHNGSRSGSLFTTNGGSYRGATSPQSVGALVDAGELQCTSGFCGGAVAAQTKATFAGTFVHTGSSAATAVVFHADGDLRLDEILLTSEMVQNAHNGNGMEVFVRVYAGSAVHDLGSVLVTYANTTTAAIQTLYTPGLVLGAGDAVEIRYDARGTYLYDHSNVDVRITTSEVDTDPVPVPEPASLGLVLLALGLGGAVRPCRRARAGARPAPRSSRA